MATAAQKDQRRDFHWRSLEGCSARVGLMGRVSHNFLRSARGSFVKKPRLVPIDRKRNDAPESARTKRVLDVASAIATMPEDRVRERYHELVDKKPNLSPLERFEFERIEARLDAEDVDAAQEARNRDWDRRRNELLDSIGSLVDRLRQEQF